MIAGQNYGELVLTTTFTTMVEDNEVVSAPAEISTLDVTADHDVNDIAEYVPMNDASEEEILTMSEPEEEVLDFDLDVTATNEESEEDVW
jgi:hypothetical protein